VLRASGYEQIPVAPILGVTGALSLASAILGAHTSNLAAISAALCTGPDCHPDPKQRWVAGMPYMATYVLFAALAPSLVAVFAMLPLEIVKTVAGLALASALVGALTTAFSSHEDKFTPGLTFAVTASGMTMFGVGAAFWGLAIGLIVQGIGRLTARGS
jgi:benzoate membrane transport protein